MLTVQQKDSKERLLIWSNYANVYLMLLQTDYIPTSVMILNLHNENYASSGQCKFCVMSVCR